MPVKRPLFYPCVLGISVDAASIVWLRFETAAAFDYLIAKLDEMKMSAQFFEPPASAVTAEQAHELGMA